MGLIWTGETVPHHQHKPETPVQQEGMEVAPEATIPLPDGVIPKPSTEPLHIDVQYLPHPYAENPNQRFHEKIRERRMRNND